MDTVSPVLEQKGIEISPVDALWVLIQNQTKSVRQALKKRLLEDEEVTHAQQKMVRESLTKSFEDLRAGRVKHDARSLFTK